MTEANPLPRAASRIVLLDPEDRVLLFKLVDIPTGRWWWFTPGGGLDSDETHEAAALRELVEEVGLREVTLGPCIWTREHVFPWPDGTWYRQRERYFLARVPRFEVSRAGHLDYEAETIVDHRWWSLAEIKAASTETFAPRHLSALLQQLLTEGPPPAPIDAGD
jgi:8-oxo-dGTP pyrophosphatase MutT (NUDIX family)